MSLIKIRKVNETHKTSDADKPVDKLLAMNIEIKIRGHFEGQLLLDPNVDKFYELF